MAYADYDFYLNVYFGNVIAPEDFPRLAERASEYVYSVTKGLVEKVSGRDMEAVQKAVCAVAEVLLDESIMNANAFSGEASVSSETVGSWSKSCSSTGLSAAQVEDIVNRKRDAILLYLADIPAFARIFKVRSYRCLHQR